MSPTPSPCRTCPGETGPFSRIRRSGSRRRPISGLSTRSAGALGGRRLYRHRSTSRGGCSSRTSGPVADVVDERAVHMIVNRWSADMHRHARSHELCAGSVRSVLNRSLLWGWLASFAIGGWWK
jgi:hypothetical protein